MADTVVSKVYRILTNASTNAWDKISFWTKASDVTNDAGSNLQATIGGIKGLTTSTSVTETGYAADATTVKNLNDNLVAKFNATNTATPLNDLLAWCHDNNQFNQNTTSYMGYFHSSTGLFHYNAYVDVNTVFGSAVNLNNGKNYYIYHSKNGGAATVTPFSSQINNNFVNKGINYFPNVSPGASNLNLNYTFNKSSEEKIAMIYFGIDVGEGGLDAYQIFINDVQITYAAMWPGKYQTMGVCIPVKYGDNLKITNTHYCYGIGDKNDTYIAYYN